MKKQKYLNTLYQNPILNFPQILDLIIYFEENDKLDWASEAVASIQTIDHESLANLLISDMDHRELSCIENYGYQRVWWSLINNQKVEVFNIIKSKMNINIENMFIYWLENELDNDTETYQNIKKLI